MRNAIAVIQYIVGLGPTEKTGVFSVLELVRNHQTTSKMPIPYERLHGSQCSPKQVSKSHINPNKMLSGEDTCPCS